MQDIKEIEANRFGKITTGNFVTNWKFDSPGSFFVLNDALVIMDLETVVTVVVDGVKAEMPIGPSLGWPKFDENIK